MSTAQTLLASVARDGFIACVDAHWVAAQLGLSPQALGALVDEGGLYRFDRCQLGLFGYGQKGSAGYKIVQPAAFCPEDISRALTARAIDGRVPCRALWDVADEFRYPRLQIANIAQALGLKVKPCQLGCF